MITLFGTLNSGNVHKVALLLTRLELRYRRVDVAQARGEPTRPEYLAINPMGKVPAVMTSDGDIITESAAILFFFAQGSELWPATTRARTEVVRWLAWEQYSHEPSLAVMRYLLHFSGETQDPDVVRRIRELRPRAERALAVLEDQLSASTWVAGSRCSIADYALYPYTRTTPECGLDLDGLPAVSRWLEMMESEPNHLAMYEDGARSVMAFDDYFGGSAERPSGESSGRRPPSRQDSSL